MDRFTLEYGAFDRNEFIVWRQTTLDISEKI